MHPKIDRRFILIIIFYVQYLVFSVFPLGEELTIANLTERITITLSITLPQSDKTYECHYWDTVNQAWSSDGLETVLNQNNSDEVECLTDHLTAFTVLAVDNPTSNSPTDQATDTATNPATNPPAGWS